MKQNLRNIEQVIIFQNDLVRVYQWDRWQRPALNDYLNRTIYF